MERHLSHFELEAVFSQRETLPEVRAAVTHLAGCPHCWEHGARVVAALRRSGLLIQPSDVRAAVLTLFAEEERQALDRLLARVAWAELKLLSPEDQLTRVRTEVVLQTKEFFDELIGEASAVALSDPYLGEETARLAHALAASLPRHEYPDDIRNDLQGEALRVVGNCCRLAADWRSAGDALAAAKNHLVGGSGEPRRQARLLSIEASLATDTGHLEQAQGFLARAASLYKRAGDPSALASTMVKAAGTLLAACRHEEAIATAEEALGLLTPRDTHLEVLARNIVTASLVFLGRPAAALRIHLSTWPLREHLAETRFDLQAEYLEALLLDSLGHTREADKAFRSNIERRMEAELYKDAFLTLLTRFELLFRRGALDRAARACEDALDLMRQAGAACHSQMEEIWRSLLALVHTRQLSEHHLVAARRYLARHWNSPARHASLETLGAGVIVSDPSNQEPAGTNLLVRSEPALVDAPAPVNYEAALERYDRQLISAGLAQCRGRVGETARLLGISRNTLRGKMARFGLAVVQEDSRTERAVLDALGENERAGLNRLRARAWWAELKQLAATEQHSRVRTVLALQTRELFDTLLEDSSASALSDPHYAQNTASLAYALAGILPPSRCPESVKQDLQAAALRVVANCQRLAGDWQRSAASLQAARDHLARGTSNPAHEARLLSMQASLATDMGHHERALALLRRAAGIYRSVQDSAGLALTAVKEAGTLLAACRHQEAIARAEEAMRMLTPRQSRLETLARSIVTASLVFLGQPTEALRSLSAAMPLFTQFRGRPSTDFQLTYLEALVLDSLGLLREAEIVFRGNVEGRMEAGLYKDAFLTLLTRVELLFRRGELDKAAQACAQAIAMMESAGVDRHAQTIALFRELLILIEAQRLTEPHLLEARQALVRCWAAQPATVAEADQVPKPLQGRGFLAPEPPVPPARLEPGDYEAVLVLYEREVLAEGLAQAQGRIRETCRLLGISRNMLRERMSRYGLRESGSHDAG